MLDHALLREIQTYIQTHIEPICFKLQESIYFIDSAIENSTSEDALEDFIKENRKPSLSSVLFSFIDQTGETDATIYNRAGIDRKLFSKIRTNPNYHPRKSTILALALALQLNKDDTDILLNAAGYSLSSRETSDLIVQFCIEKKIYNIFDVNQALEHFHEKPLNGLL